MGCAVDTYRNAWPGIFAPGLLAVLQTHTTPTTTTKDSEAFGGKVTPVNHVYIC